MGLVFTLGGVFAMCTEPLTNAGAWGLYGALMGYPFLFVSWLWYRIFSNHYRAHPENYPDPGSAMWI
jgi:hypothetical protein